MKRLLIAALVCFSLPALAFHGSRDSNYNRAISIGSTYQGPGDVVSGALVWYSCARAYNAAYANAGGAACDVVDTSTGLVACTYHVTTSGFVNPSECNGAGQSCATACSVTKAYDQTGNGRDASNATLAGMPPLNLSSTPKGTLPALTCNNFGTQKHLASTATITQNQPMTFSAVFIRTSGTTISSGVIGTGGIRIGGGTGASLAMITAGSELDGPATDNVWHAVNALANGASSVVTVDGTDSSGNVGANNLSAVSIALCNAASSPLNGNIAEAGLWPTGSSIRSTLNTNQHGINGYNF